MAFQQALSGLNTAASAIDVTSNNIANASTVGFKVSRSHFSDAFAASLQNTGASLVGIGANVASVAQQFTQGTLTSTKNPLDIAISGAGFFRMEAPAGDVTFSRNGQFSINKAGFLVNDDGLQLTGYEADETGAVNASQPEPIFINPADLSPVATGTSTGLVGYQGVRANLNLDSRQLPPTEDWVTPAPGEVGLQTVSPLTYNFSSTITLYDTLGNPHTMSLYFAKPDAPLAPVVQNTSDWEVRAIVDGTSQNHVTFVENPNSTSATLAPPPDTQLPTGSALRIRFDSTGKMIDPYWDGLSIPAGMTSPAPNPDWKPQWQVQINMDGVAADLGLTNSASTVLGKSDQAPGTLLPGGTPTRDTADGSLQGFLLDLTGTTSFGSSNGVNRLQQDGFSSGRLTGVGIGEDGTIVGRYTNGQNRTLGQVVLANFTNPNGLKPIGDSQWLETNESGPPTIGAPGSSSLGILQASAIEESNVDLTEELVAMIVQQRAYQANAQSIKTQDSILNTIVNLR